MKKRRRTENKEEEEEEREREREREGEKGISQCAPHNNNHILSRIGKKYEASYSSCDSHEGPFLPECQ